MIELAYFGGLTHVEIASMLDTPVGTVKGRMRLGLAKMRWRWAIPRRWCNERRRASHERPDGCGENAAPYVLGALTDEEHEASGAPGVCAVCREEVAALQVVADALPAAAPQLSAPPELKRRVMASVREDARSARGAPSRRGRDPPSRSRAAALAAALASGARAAVRAAWRAGGDRARAPAAGGAAHARDSRAGDPGARERVAERRRRARAAEHRRHAADGRGRVYEVWVKRSGRPQPTDALFTVTRRAAHGRRARRA